MNVEFCPFCSGELQEKVHKCGHCGETLHAAELNVVVGYCMNCGAPFSPHERECSRCGTPKHTIKAKSQTPKVSTNPAKQYVERSELAKDKNNHLKHLLVGFLLILLLLLLGGRHYFFGLLLMLLIPLLAGRLYYS